MPQEAYHCNYNTSSYLCSNVLSKLVIPDLGTSQTDPQAKGREKEIRQAERAPLLGVTTPAIAKALKQRKMK